MKDVPENLVSEMVHACHEAARRGLVRCSSGNMSRRVDAERMVVTTTRSWMDRLTVNDLALCRIADGSVLEGGRPTVEVGLHAGILRARPEMDVVLHFQTPAATTLACQGTRDINYYVIPEMAFYIGPVGYVPYATPGSSALAAAVSAVMHDHDLAQMANHGQVIVARDFDHAIQNAEFFELACRILVAAGPAVTPLPETAVRSLLALRPAGRADVV